MFLAAISTVTHFNSSLAGKMMITILHANTGDPDAAKLNVSHKFSSVLCITFYQYTKVFSIQLTRKLSKSGDLLEAEGDLPSCVKSFLGVKRIAGM